MDRKLQRHRADSLRQHGFLVLFIAYDSCTVECGLLSFAVINYVIYASRC